MGALSGGSPAALLRMRGRVWLDWVMLRGSNHQHRECVPARRSWGVVLAAAIGWACAAGCTTFAKTKTDAPPPQENAHLELVPQWGHLGAIRALAVSRDEELLASAGEDGTVKLWRLKSGLLVRTIEDHVGPVNAVVLTERPDLVITGGEDGRISVREAVSGALVWMTEPGSPILRLASGENSLAAWTSEGQVIEYALDRGTRLRAVDVKSTLGGLIFDGRWIVAVEDLGRTVLIDLLEPQTRVDIGTATFLCASRSASVNDGRIFWERSGAVFSVGFSAGEAADKIGERTRTLSNLTIEQQSLPDLSYYLARSNGSWACGIGGTLYESVERFGVRKYAVTSVSASYRTIDAIPPHDRYALAFAERSDKLVIGGLDGVISMPGALDGWHEVPLALPGNVRFGADDTIELGIATRSLQPRFNLRTSNGSPLRMGSGRDNPSGILSPDGTMVAIIGRESVDIYDPERPLNKSHAFKATAARAVRFSPSSRLLVFQRANRYGVTLSFIDIKSGRSRVNDINLLLSPLEPVVDIAFSRDESALWVTTSRRLFRLDLQNATWEAVAGVTGAAESPRAGTVAVVAGGEIRILEHEQDHGYLLDWKSQAPEAGFGRTTHPRPPLAWSSDSSLLAVNSDEEGVQVWSTSNHLKKVTLGPPSRNVRSIAFRDDGRLIAVVTGDGQVRVFSVDTGALLVTLLRFPDGEWVSHDPRGTFVASPGGEQHLAFRREDGSFHPMDGGGLRRSVMEVLPPAPVNPTPKPSLAPMVAQPSSQARPAAAPAPSPPEAIDPSKRFALVIGVEEYESADISQARFADNDASKLADAFHRAGFPADHIIHLGTDLADPLRPRRSTILEKFSALRRKIKEAGSDVTLVFAFSGHGIERGGNPYLLASDTRAGDANLLEATAISMESIKKWLLAAGARRILVLIDACRNDPETAKAVSGPVLSKALTSALHTEVTPAGVDVFATFWATSPGQRAYWSTTSKLGFFTAAIVEGLSGREAEGGVVTLKSLKKFVETEVPARVDKEHSTRQVPWMDVSGVRAEEMVLAVPGP